MKSKWSEFVVRQQQGMSGSCVREMIGFVSGLVGADLLYVTEVDGALVGELPTEQFTPGGSFMQLCSTVKQFDWADIYLTKGTEHISDFARLQMSASYAEKIERTLATIRVVDTEYFYLYLRDDAARQCIDRFNLLAPPSTGNLTEFNYPI
jgi:hypothetical protein